MSRRTPIRDADPAVWRRRDSAGIQRLRRALLDPRSLRQPKPHVLAEVHAVLAQNPAASRDDVFAAVHRRREDVLDAVRAVRAAQEPFPDAWSGS